MDTIAATDPQDVLVLSTVHQAKGLEWSHVFVHRLIEDTAAMGVREQPGLPAAEAVARALARQQVLLVLDNCEHVIGAAAALCAGLLAACDDVRVLATSREPLRVAGEARYRLASLALPDLDDLADAGRSEAVALFADRARGADAHFTLDDQNAPAWRGW